MARKIVITSGKGGVGKTTITANFGMALAKNGLKVLLFDADVGLNNLDVVMGVENKIVYDLNDIVMGKCRPSQALIQDFFTQNLYVLPSGRLYCGLELDSELLSDILDSFDECFDYILIDCPAGIEGGFLRAVNCSNEAIVVTTPNLSAIRDSNKVVGILQSMNIKISGLVVNRVRGDLILDKEMLSIEDISAYLKIAKVCAIPEDDVVGQQVSKMGHNYRSGEIYLAFGSMVSMIDGGDKKVYDCTKKYRGLIGTIKRNLRKWV